MKIDEVYKFIQTYMIIVFPQFIFPFWLSQTRDIFASPHARNLLGVHKRKGQSRIK